MNPSGMRGLRLYGAVAALAMSALATRADEVLSDGDFIDSYNRLEPMPWPKRSAKKRSPKIRSHVAYEQPPSNTEHEQQARKSRQTRGKGSSLLDKARRAKGRI
jgi:hypothetical protein